MLLKKLFKAWLSAFRKSTSCRKVKWQESMRRTKNLLCAQMRTSSWESNPDFIKMILESSIGSETTTKFMSSLCLVLTLFQNRLQRLTPRGNSWDSLRFHSTRILRSSKMPSQKRSTTWMEKCSTRSRTHTSEKVWFTNRSRSNK